MSDYELDNTPLLVEMMSDQARADTLYRPTPFWGAYEDELYPELIALGLRDYRRRADGVLVRLGAVDRSGLDIQDCYAKVKAKANGWDLARCGTTRIGNPEHVEEIDGALWSTHQLRYCSHFIDAAEWIPFSDEMVFCELGCGSGRQVEIIANMFPKATILAFDIAPELYVAHQYLTAVFGDRVVPYREAKHMHIMFAGRIALLPAWAMPKWSTAKIDVFWNATSFSEMEPHVVENYLQIVRSMRPEHIYIDAPPGGHDALKSVTAKLYRRELVEYEQIAEYPSEYFIPKKNVAHIFRRVK